MSFRKYIFICFVVLISLACHLKTQHELQQISETTTKSRDLEQRLNKLGRDLELIDENHERLNIQSHELQESLLVMSRKLEQEKDLDCNKADFLNKAKENLDEAKKTAEQTSVSEIHLVNANIEEQMHQLNRDQFEMKGRIHHLEEKKHKLSNALEKAEGNIAVGHVLTDNDPIFTERFVQRLLDNKDSYSGSYVYNQQIAVQESEKIIVTKWGGNKTTIGLMTKEFRRLLPKRDPFLYPRRIVYGTCAVVGNSGKMLYHKRGASVGLGEEIDAHSAVIRLNAGITRGFEDFVGNKTTLRFVNRLHFGFQEKNQEVILQQVTNEQVLQKFVAHKRKFPTSRFFMLSTDFQAHVQRQLISPATNGFFALVFALQRCKRVRLYGFYRTENQNKISQSIPYHYFDAEVPQEAQKTRDLKEWPLIMELARRSDRLDIVT